MLVTSQANNSEATYGYLWKEGRSRGLRGVEDTTSSSFISEESCEALERRLLSSEMEARE